MFKFSIIIFALYLNSTLADLNKLKKVNDCVCYCPKEDTSSEYKNTVQNTAISQSIPGGQTKKVDYNYINLPGKSHFVTHYHRRNSTSRSSTRKNNRKKTNLSLLISSFFSTTPYSLLRFFCVALKYNSMVLLRAAGTYEDVGLFPTNFCRMR